MTVTVTITNEERLLRKLTRLPAAFVPKIKEAMAAQADEIVEMMRRLVPVESGDLRDSIGWTWGGRAPSGSISVASVAGVGRGDLTITIFAGNNAAYYARWQEFGTVKMPANPFFYVSWRAGRKNARRRIQAALRQAAKQVAAGG